MSGIVLLLNADIIVSFLLLLVTRLVIYVLLLRNGVFIEGFQLILKFDPDKIIIRVSDPNKMAK